MRSAQEKIVAPKLQVEDTAIRQWKISKYRIKVVGYF